jgi:HAD superfamily hydrolase (TIGR01509 family)
MTSRFTPPNNLEHYDAFIFDCDGTLADTMPAHFIAWRRALAEGGLTLEFGWSLFVSRAGMSMESTVLELGAQFAQGLDANQISLRQRAIFHELSERIEPISEVCDFARSLFGKHPIAVASGSSRKSVERTLTAISVRDLFEVIVTPEDVEHGKPSPDSFLLAAKKLGVDPERCLVIEDAELGFEAARRAGMDYAVVDCPDPTRV